MVMFLKKSFLRNKKELMRLLNIEEFSRHKITFSYKNGRHVLLTSSLVLQYYKTGTLLHALALYTS